MVGGILIDRTPRRNARATSEPVIAAIGLSIGVLTLPMYTIVVLIAVVTSLMAAPLVRYCVARIPGGAHAGAEAPGGTPELEGVQEGR